MQPCWVWLCDLDSPRMSKPKPSVPRLCCTQGLALRLLILSGDLGDAFGLRELPCRGVSLTRSALEFSLSLCVSSTHIFPAVQRLMDSKLVPP